MRIRNKVTVRSKELFFVNLVTIPFLAKYLAVPIKPKESQHWSRGLTTSRLIVLSSSNRHTTPFRDQFGWKAAERTQW